MAVDLSAVEVGHQTFLEEGGEEFGAIREVMPEGRPVLMVYIENAGDFIVGAGAIRSVHDGKVVFDRARLDSDILAAIAHAHDEEQV
jgi:hypothetical protein